MHQKDVKEGDFLYIRLVDILPGINSGDSREVANYAEHN
jgi:hypothetical protein